MMSIFKQTHLG